MRLEDDVNLSQPIRIGRREFDTSHGDLAEIQPGSDIFEVIPLWRDWCLQVPYRHATYGWPVLWKVRLVRVTEPAQQS